ncbi:hypothetical protein [Cellulomonas hominis]|uniref:hypothetical protein n=1 Tax=Cellulomonas hominis TaxID=156981 RepID=UPI001B981E1E|nr:hypothetical protein [Cellulomonas hominis]VTR77747.1 hypothetical protein CHMI_02519 [Cellulomonas hominis]
MPTTTAQQRNAVSEGIALGFAMCDLDELPFDKLRIDLAFDYAWRQWPHAHRFPQVQTDLRNGTDPVWVMTHADEKKQVWNLFWDRSAGSSIRIYARSRWEDDFDADAIASMVDDDIPAEDWMTFAQDFLRAFER